ncbi:hypothetical protein BX666DRAFT_764038 [Dichotomocladium elegans]|nr:hypothetical protein BX666DRAFT_764038 [Dichotomocladium elegans]
MKRSILLLAVVLLQCLGFALAQTDAKTQRLADLAKKNKGIVKLTSNTFSQYTEGKRNYGIVVLLTALDDNFNCIPCREFDPEFKLVAASFQKTKNPNSVFFGHLDFKDGQAIYQKLNLQTAPNVLYFPPAKPGQRVEPAKYDLSRSGFQAESFAQFLSQQIGAPVPVDRPYDYIKLGLKIFLFVGGAAILKLMYQHFGLILHHKYSWASFSILFIVIMISGQMWNQIRNPPYVAAGPGGKMNFIAGGFQQQLGLESRIVASIYGLLAMGTIALAVFVPKISDKNHQRICVYVWITSYVVVFSILLNLFKFKNGGYPFKLLF